MTEELARRMTVTVADITTLEVDAIINAANGRMLGGGGVDGAIHRTAGPELLAACRAVPEVRPGVRCPTGEARLTGGFDLPARHVIHTVGPVWHGGGDGEEDLLAACYRNCLQLAHDHGDVDTIAFPAISTGVYGYPSDAAAGVAVRAVVDFLEGHARPRRVTFCCFGDASAAAHRAALERA